MKKKTKLDDNVCPGCDWYIDDEEVGTQDIIVENCGQRWHTICYDADQRSNTIADSIAKDYDPQEDSSLDRYGKNNFDINIKTAQHLQLVKTPEMFNEREITRALRDAIINEEVAIQQYELIADAVKDSKIKNVMQHIADEERVHVGEITELLKNILPDEQEMLEEGAKEVQEEK